MVCFGWLAANDTDKGANWTSTTVDDRIMRDDTRCKNQCSLRIRNRFRNQIGSCRDIVVLIFKIDLKIDLFVGFCWFLLVFVGWQKRENPLENN